MMNDRGIITSYLLTPLSKITNPVITSHFKLVKDSNSNRVSDLLRHNTIPVTLYNILLTFRDTGKELEFKADLLKMITNKNYNVNLASLSDKKLLYDFANKMFFNVKATSNKSARDRPLIRLLRSPAITTSGNSTVFLPSVTNELCERLWLLLEEKEAGNNFEIINEKIVAKIDKLLEYKCISKKQHKQILIKGSLLHTRKK